MMEKGAYIDLLQDMAFQLFSLGGEVDNRHEALPQTTNEVCLWNRLLGQIALKSFYDLRVYTQSCINA